MADKVAYAVHANVNAFETWVGGKRIRVEDGKPYQTSDPTEIAVIDDAPSIKRVTVEQAAAEKAEAKEAAASAKDDAAKGDDK